MQSTPAIPTPTSISAPTPNPCQPDTYDEVRALMKEFTEIRGIQSAFNAFIVHDDNYAEEVFNTLQSKLAKVLSEGTSPESVERAIKHIISITGQPTNNDETVEILMKILEKLVASSNVSARLVCEALLESERLTIRNSKFWINSFVLIKKIIPGVDYKGVREIMKISLDKAALFPEKILPSQLPQLNAVVRLLQYIFDRNACLLPAYFIVNEILKNYPEKRQFPHWKLSQLLSDFVDSFQPIAQMVTVIGRSRMLPVVEHSHSGYSLLSWKLDPVTLRFVVKGNLPYDKDLLQPQDRLLRFILEQPYSRDMVCAILGLQKQLKIRCSTLEDRLVELVIVAMEKTEAEMNQANDPQSGYDEISAATLWLWQHLSTQLIFFVLFQLASFPHIVMSIHNKLSEIKLFKGRDFLMWVLLQFISGSIQKNSLGDFLPVLRLYDLLYPEKDALVVPDITKPYCVSQMAATCIWIHILKKAQTENQFLCRPLPTALKKQYEYLQSIAVQNSTQPSLNVCDFRVALLANAFSTNSELFSRPMGALVEAMHGSTSSSVSSQISVAPLSVQILDSLTVHTKMSLIHNIVTHIMKISTTKSGQNLNPALVETYARLLVYLEIESLGIKGFMSQLLPNVFKSQAWGILHTLLEMFCYRLHHIQPHYRVQLLSHLNALANNAHSNSAQLHMCVETTALRLITSFNSVDVHTQFSRVGGDCKSLVSSESEELNRALVLTLARAIHVTGSDTIAGSGGSNWYRDILTAIMQNTPHSWSTHVLQAFPPVVYDFFQQNQVPKENKQQLKNMVDEEYRNWNAMISNEKELIEHFASQGTPPLFLCILWKMVLETDRVNPVAPKVIERIGPKGISANLRKFCDYVVCEFANAGAGQYVNKLADAISDLIWKFNIIPFDRLLLCLALRSHEGNEAQVCFFIIHMLLIKPLEFKNRIQEFVRDNSPEHWKQTSWHEKHKSFNAKYPEVSYFEGQQQNPIPMYFGNVCLRFLPVFDIMIHRFLEMNNIQKSLELMLEQMSPLYKFHDRPVTYLYNTLHYYESRLRDKPSLKKKLISAILGALRDIKPTNWALSDQYQTFLQGSNEDINWAPDIDYYAGLINRFVDVIEGRRKFFAPVDWRFNEFPNPPAHVLHATCVEIMALPVTPTVAANGILEVMMCSRAEMDANEANMDVESWFNSTGLILVTLPESYWLLLHERIVSTIEKLSTWSHKYTPLQLFNFKTVKNGFLYSEYANLLAITHAVWYHLGIGHMHHIQTLITDKLSSIVQNEIQLLFIGHLVAPFLQRLNTERPNMVCRLTVAFYELLEKVDKSISKDACLTYMDVFCDLLYHIKYMYTGDVVKTDVEPIIGRLRPALQLRFRFITHLNIEDISVAAPSQGTTQVPATNQNLQNMLGMQGMKYSHD
ncbi:Mediator of RNA polymerase II transcription subunit 23 [Orchesella cincta]|uniref:Mediator of RNA polymerase II transcription subunit 23 n=1 Tax=Orchesella cincta TaxID=48709 RepID=A0A1D2NIV8_ORCCI|nr:Mediator of RNA polymerase II transcription subunit 23 [Orchesella cincta]